MFIFSLFRSRAVAYVRNDFKDAALRSLRLSRTVAGLEFQLEVSDVLKTNFKDKQNCPLSPLIPVSTLSEIAREKSSTGRGGKTLTTFTR